MGTKTERSLHLLISGPLHDKLRWLALQDETTLAEIVRQSLRKLVRERVPQDAVLLRTRRRGSQGDVSEDSRYNGGTGSVPRVLTTPPRGATVSHCNDD
jgi:hypothetical protein